MRCAAIIVAAGRGERFGATLPKALVTLAGRTLLAHAVERFAASGVIERIIVVAPAGEVDRCQAELKGHAGLVSGIVVAGGPRRQDSVRFGLEAVAGDIEIVVVHDAARPLVSGSLIRRTIERALATGAAIAALPVTDTVKEVDGQGTIVGSPPRDNLWLAQTPQAFRATLLRDAHERARREGRQATDDAALVEAAGGTVAIVPGDPGNLKITVPDDLRLAELWLGDRERNLDRGG